MPRHVVAAALLGACLALTPVQAAAVKVTLIVHIENYAGARIADLVRAGGEASRIYEDVGVQLLWLSMGESPQTKIIRGPAIDAHILLLDHDMAQRMIVEEHRADNVLGRAVPEAWRAYIFYDRVMNAASVHNLDRGVVLGKVIAHEMGHLFLGHSHAQTGLMRPELDLRSTIGFTPPQGVIIRETIVAVASGFH